MPKDETKQTTASSFLLGVLITIVLAVAAFGFNSIDKKLDSTVYTEHKESQIRREDKVDDELGKMNDKLDIIIKKL